MLRLFPLALLATTLATPLDSRQECTPCNPQGASGMNPPAVGSDLKSLYVDLLASVKNIHFQKRWENSVVPRDDGFCCRQTLDCVNVQNLNIPMCYDKFTTQFAFADGSYGSLTTGDYTSGESKANLITGEYTKAGGEKGDIYAQDPQAKPNTATMSIPPQWTGSGVGSAIPATELGSVVLITTTIEGTTITAPTTIPESTLLNTANGQTTAMTTIPARTITAPTTIAPITSIITSTVGAASPSSASSTGAAAQASGESRMHFGMPLFAALMYAIYAL